ncbi:MAG: helix-turn-helix transcriptional regulator [bacterium]
MDYVGKMIAKLRKKNYMTQDQLAQKLNVTFQAVSKWENSTSVPDFQTIILLSKIFDVSIYEFVEEKGE